MLVAMTWRACIAALVLTAIMAGPVAAGPFEEFEGGFAAYQRGDYATAARLWRPLAEQDYAGAQYNLGNMYAQGQGVPQDHTEAMKWYRLAADQGLAEAQSNLGVMYAQGQGVPQDHVQAHMWSILAAEQGHENARKNREIIAARMTREQLAEAQRLAREWKPKR